MFALWIALACAQPTEATEESQGLSEVTSLTESPPEIRAVTTVGEAFPPPHGAERVKGDAFGDWLGHLTLAASDAPVRTYEGATVGHRARVIEFGLVDGDLQQCADTAIRARAEWLKEKGLPISFHATSGDPMPYSRWLNGEHPYASGQKLAWKRGKVGSWEGYLSAVFMYAGTRSLDKDTVAATVPLPGDIVVVPGSPGHAVLLLDVAKKGEQTYVLVGEGYMPAQQFHVELGPDDGWWPWGPGIELDHWSMPASGLRRWKAVE